MLFLHFNSDSISHCRQSETVMTGSSGSKSRDEQEVKTSGHFRWIYSHLFSCSSSPPLKPFNIQEWSLKDFLLLLHLLTPEPTTRSDWTSSAEYGLESYVRGRVCAGWRSGFDSVEPVGGASYIVEELGPVWTWIWPKTETESCTGPDWSLLRTTWRKMIQAEEDRGTIWSEETRLQLYGHLTSGQRPPPGLTPYLLLTGVWLTHTADVGENLGPSWGGALPADVSCRTRRGAEMFSETTWSPVTPPLPPRAVILLLFKHRSRPTFSIPSRFW